DYSADGVKRRVTHQWLVPSVYQPEVSIDTTAIFDHPYLNERGDDDMLPSNKGFTNGSYITKRKTTDYVGNKIYEDGRLDKILFGNGYIKDNNYYFYVKDHLGNNRAVLKRNLISIDDEFPNYEEEEDPGDEIGELPVLNPRGGYYIVVQRLNYYASGLMMPGGLNPEEQKFSYNDKEFDSMHGLNMYDYEFRHYDPAIMRFTTIDPMAEDFQFQSSYVYAANNPVKFVDYKGLKPKTREEIIDQNIREGEKMANIPHWDTDETLRGKTDEERKEEEKEDEKDKIEEINEKMAEHIAKSEFEAAIFELQSGYPQSGAIHNDNILFDILFGTKGLGTIFRSQLASKGVQMAAKEGTKVGAKLIVNTGTKTAFRSFTSSNFRYNLGKFTGSIPAKSQAHHIFPKKHAPDFFKAGININNPKYGVWWETTSHLKNASSYNAAWGEFLLKDRTPSEILNFGRQLMSEYGFIVGF
ncbi:MAG: hypothetical protein FWH18_01915, partial [Marinilabiliaceae bacterium]|nr:hypothetical protein [Marinilabiliaceae bacterium]